MKLLREKPYAFEVYTEHADSVCWNCLRSDESAINALHRCSRCRFARYCNSQCQMQHFPDHKLQCRLLKQSAPCYPNAWVRLTAQLMLKGQQPRPTNIAVGYNDDGSEFPLAENRPITDLMSHYEELTSSDPIYYVECMRVLEFTGKPNPSKMDDELEEVAKLLCKLKINSVTIHHSGTSFGLGLYLNYSALNHSCNPNCSTVFDGKDLVLYSLTPDKTLRWDPKSFGQEGLTIEYTSSLETTVMRRKFLEKVYCFKCECLACTDVDRDAEMLAVICATCGTGLATPVDGGDGGGSTVNADPFKFPDYMRQNPHARKCFEKNLKCNNPACGKIHSFADYPREFAKLALLFEEIDNIAASGKFARICSRFADLKKSFVPEFNIVRYRVCRKILQNIMSRGTIDGCVPLFLESFVESIKFYHHYLHPGHSTRVADYEAVASVMLRQARDMQAANKENFWRDPQFQKCIEEGQQWCKDHLAILESVYGPGYPDCVDFWKYSREFDELKINIDQRQKSGDGRRSRKTIRRK